MPGLFGAFNCDARYQNALKERFSALFDSCEWKQFPNGILGAHAFDGGALQQTGSACHYVVDGESCIYRAARTPAKKGAPLLFNVRDGRFETTELCKGNVVLLDESRCLLFLSTDWCGVFPLYYAQMDGGILFSSHCKPLAAVIGSSRDYVGAVEYMLSAYFIGDRTPFQGIHRLLPGQALTYCLKDKTVSLEERSRYWSGSLHPDSPELNIGHVWETFLQACRRCFDLTETHGIMLSAGWDSRLVLAGLLHLFPKSRIRSISFGDLKSRELKLSRRLARSSGVKHLELPLKDHLTDMGQVRKIFERCETAAYPYWYRAVQHLAAEGVTCVCGGLQGEVFGGHYGVGELQGPWQKVMYFGSHVVPVQMPTGSRPQDFEQAVGLVEHGYDRRPWYIKEDFWQSSPRLREAILNDIHAEVKRYKVAGVTNADQFFEAFRAEHAGTQWFCGQILTCRAGVDIAIPFADREFMMLASRTPMRLKIYNSLSRKLLKAFAPQLSRYPTGATLVPANFPVILQEASRLLRWVVDRTASSLYFAWGRRIDLLHSDWRNIPALRDGVALNRLTDDIRLDLLDKVAIRRSIADIARLETRIRPEALAHQLLRIYTMDLMLR